MRSTFIRRLVGIAAALIAGTAVALAAPAAQAAPRAVTGYTPPSGVTDPCPSAAPGDAGCAALISKPTDKAAARSAAAASTPPAGYSPADLRSAYDLSSSLGSSETVAVVTAYNDTAAASDLAAYRTQYTLPACTTTNGCFKQVSQTGSSTLPGTSAGWTAPVAESVDMISAICPNCHILVVEANSSAISDLGTAENEAVTLGAKFIDNDWVFPEAQFSSAAAETADDSAYFDHPGVAITAPAGEGGYGVINYPAASPYVTAVGGTTLTADASVPRGWDETAWSGTSSGCSAYEPKPSWQTDTGCADRTLNDTAADADFNTPVAYYDTSAEGGWGKGSGTTVAAAIIAAAYALAGTPAPGSYPASYLYTHPGALWPITSGSDGTCSVSYLCTAGPGYNGPAGNGTPFADTAFHTVGAKPVTVTGTNGTTWVFATDTSGAIETASLASGSSTWSALASLGGTWSGYPAALASSDGSIWVFGLNAGNLYVDQLPHGSATWSGWTEIGDPGIGLIGTPTAVQEKSGAIDVFVRNATGNLCEVQLPSGSATWSGFTNLGGTLPNNVSAEVGGGGFIHVVGVGNNSELYVDTLPTGGTWSGWTAVAGAVVTGVPAIIQDAAGNVRVYVRRASDGALLENDIAAGTSTWTGFTVLTGGSWINDPVAWGGSGGTVWVFEIGSGTYINYDKLPSGGTAYSGWTGIASGFAGVPGIVQDNGGSDHLFARASSGNLEVDTLPAGTSAWPPFTSLGGPVAGS